MIQRLHITQLCGSGLFEERRDITHKVGVCAAILSAEGRLYRLRGDLWCRPSSAESSEVGAVILPSTVILAQAATGVV